MRHLWQPAVARLVASATYMAAIGVSTASRLWRRRRHTPRGRLVLVGTFYNANWFVSHATPLALSGLSEVIVVTDFAQPAPENVRFACPPRLVSAVLGRVGSKLVWLVWVGLRYRPDVYMGYHVFPNATFALIVGRLFGRVAGYQMTGGPIEVIDGGIGSENLMLSRLGTPSRSLERLSLAVVRRFDLVVVRGQSARAFLRDHRVTAPIAVIPGSVDPSRFQGQAQRTCDLVFVGRFTETKQPMHFVEVVAAVARRRPSVRAIAFGDGPEAGEVQAAVTRLGLEGNLQLPGRTSEIDSVLAASRIFVLTSRTEGLSIAMAEAMMCGVVPVVADVGDLRDLVREGENGYLVRPGDIEAFAARVLGLLDDPALWRRLSSAAVEAARGYVGVARVTGLWTEQLAALGALPTAPKRG